MAELKTKKTAASVPAFIASVKDSKRKRDAQAALGFMKEATGMRPKMWGGSIVGFGEYDVLRHARLQGDATASEEARTA